LLIIPLVQKKYNSFCLKVYFIFVQIIFLKYLQLFEKCGIICKVS